MKLQWKNIKQTALSTHSCTAVPNVHKGKKASILHPVAANNSKKQWHEINQWYDELAAGEGQHLLGQHAHSDCAAAAASRKHRLTNQKAEKKCASINNFYSEFLNQKG